MENQGPDVSVAIVNFWTRDLVEQCLQSIREETRLSYEVLLVDNSFNDLPDDLATSDDNVRLIRNEENVGFARATNEAYRKSHGRHFLLLNPDAVVRSAAIDRMVRYMDAHPDVGVVGPRILNPDGSPQPSAQAFPTLFSLVANLFGFKGLLPTPAIRRFAAGLLKFNPVSSMNPRTPGGVVSAYLANYDPDPEARDVDWVSGACLLVCREAMDVVGLLDEGFFLYWEDVDLCRRIRTAGWRVVYLPEATVIHQVGGSSRGFDGGIFVNRYASAYRYFVKNRGRQVLWLRIIYIFGMIPRLLAWTLGYLFLWFRRREMLERLRAAARILALAFQFR